MNLLQNGALFGMHHSIKMAAAISGNHFSLSSVSNLVSQFEPDACFFSLSMYAHHIYTIGQA